MKNMLWGALASFGAIAFGSLGQVLHAHGKHDNLQFSGDQRVMTFVDPKDPAYPDDASKMLTVTVTWKIDPVAANSTYHSYSVDIQIVDSNKKPVNAEKTYSLLTLGFQSIYSVRQIKSNASTDGKVQYIPAGVETPSPIATPISLSPTGTVWSEPLKKQVIAEGNIGFLRLSGSSTGLYTLKVDELPRQRVGRTVWYKDYDVGSGHDNNPPNNPPD